MADEKAGESAALPPGEPLVVAPLFERVLENANVKLLVKAADQLGKLAVIVTVINYFVEAPDRQKTKEFAAWQLLNGATSGDGGRRLAMHDLVGDNVPLSLLRFTRADLHSGNFKGATLSHTIFEISDLDEVNFSCVKPFFPFRIFERCERSSTLKGVTFDNDSLHKANFSDAYLEDVTFNYSQSQFAFSELMFRNSVFLRANFTGAIEGSDFSYAHLKHSAFHKSQFRDHQVSFNLSSPLEDSPTSILSVSNDFSYTEFEHVTFNDKALDVSDLSSGVVCHTKIDGVEYNSGCSHSRLMSFQLP